MSSEHLESRVEALERRVAELEAAAVVPAARVSPPKPPVIVTAPATRTASWAPVSTPPAPSTDRWFELGEGWLGRVGVGLLALGFVFLFRYAVDRGWLTPALRVGMGIATGGALLFSGMRFFPERPRFRQIVMAGGISLLFLTALAASEWYHLISGTAGLAFNTLVAALAFFIAVRQDDELMAAIGAAGSLLPPGFLFADSVPGVVLWLHVTLVITVTGLLYAARGWSGLLSVAALSGVAATMHQLPAGLGVRIVAIATFAAAWLFYAALPLVRSMMPVAWPRTQELRTTMLEYLVPPAVAFGLAASAATFAFPNQSAFEIVSTAATIGFSAIALGVWQRRPEASAAVFAAALTATGAAISLIDTPWSFLANGVIAAIAMMIGQQFAVPVAFEHRDRHPIIWLAHALFGFLAFTVFGIYAELIRRPPFDSYALAFVGVVACAAFTTRVLPNREQKVIYFSGIFAAVHLLLAAELGHVAGATWLASVSWGLVGGTLMLYGLSRDDRTVQRAGLVSLGLLIARLFMIDLAKAAVGVRIILFIGFGFAFLALSYLFRERKTTG